MTTARDLINDAAAELGAYAADTALADSDAQAMLRRLNRMIASWGNERLMIPAVTEQSFTMSVGVKSYSTTLLASGRPIALESGFTRTGGSDRPFRVTTEATDYDAIAVKDSTGLPELCYYMASYPNGTMYFWPAPVVAYTCYVKVRSPLASTLALTDTVALAPGYEDAIVYNLAIRCGGIFGTQPPATTVDTARETKRWLKTVNYVPTTLVNPLAPNWPRANIIAGE